MTTTRREEMLSLPCTRFPRSFAGACSVSPTRSAHDQRTESFSSGVGAPGGAPREAAAASFPPPSSIGGRLRLGLLRKRGGDCGGGGWERGRLSDHFAERHFLTTAGGRRARCGKYSSIPGRLTLRIPCAIVRTPHHRTLLIGRCRRFDTAVGGFSRRAVERDGAAGESCRDLVETQLRSNREVAI